MSGRKGECEVMEDVEVAQRMDVDGVKHQRDLQSNLLFLLCRVWPIAEVLAMLSYNGLDVGTMLSRRSVGLDLAARMKVVGNRKNNSAR